MKVFLSTAYVSQVSLTITTGVAGIAWLALAWLSMALAVFWVRNCGQINVVALIDLFCSSFLELVVYDIRF